MGKERTYEEINQKIRTGKAVVLTAEEVLDLIAEKGVSGAAKRVDVVTTGTFGPMCSSGLFLNFGHPRPRIKMSEVYLNGVPAYAGIAAVDAYLGATALPPGDPRNRIIPVNLSTEAAMSSKIWWRAGDSPGSAWLRDRLLPSKGRDIFPAFRNQRGHATIRAIATKITARQ